MLWKKLESDRYPGSCTSDKDPLRDGEWQSQPVPPLGHVPWFQAETDIYCQSVDLDLMCSSQNIDEPAALLPAGFSDLSCLNSF